MDLTETAVPTENDHRERLLGGMAAAITELGYAAVTISDVVRHARVSKRTFYEHFAGKEACLLALYEAQSDLVLSRIEAAIQKTPWGPARAEIGAAIYLRELQAKTGLLRTMLQEIFHLGPRGLQKRREVMRRFATLFQRESARPNLSPTIAMALVGGINELVLEALEDDRIDRLDELTVVVASLIRTLLGSGAC